MKSNTLKYNPKQIGYKTKFLTHETEGHTGNLKLKIISGLISIKMICAFLYDPREILEFPNP